MSLIFQLPINPHLLPVFILNSIESSHLLICLKKQQSLFALNILTWIIVSFIQPATLWLSFVYISIDSFFGALHFEQRNSTMISVLDLFCFRNWATILYSSDIYCFKEEREVRLATEDKTDYDERRVTMFKYVEKNFKFEHILIFSSTYIYVYIRRQQREISVTYMVGKVNP
jgi:hypothetical protein